MCDFNRKDSILLDVSKFIEYENINDYKESGIYGIICIQNNKIYIGSALNILRRINVHKGQLKQNKHYNKKLQNAWNKYGNKTFYFKIIEKCHKEDLISKEQYYINNFNFSKDLFNLNPTAGSCIGVIQSADTINKRRLSNPNRREVHMLDINTGESIKTFLSIGQAADFFNMKNTSILRALDSPTKIAAGYRWVSKNAEIPKYDFQKSNDITIKDAMVIANVTMTAICLWCKEKRFLSRKNKVGKTLINKESFNLFISTYKSKALRDKERQRSICSINLETNECVFYESISGAAKELNINMNYIMNALSGRSKTSHMCKWYYAQILE